MYRFSSPCKSFVVAKIWPGSTPLRPQTEARKYRPGWRIEAARTPTPVTAASIPHMMYKLVLCLILCLAPRLQL
uniref:Uncharacterized protein n=1 Tax=Diadromus pulchellus ascovirus 4a TaxID=158683 RepID=Q9DSV9_9VIRU|nr:hypothetical protein [Diadromus pulchellus ascovirus 4a]